MPVAQQLAEADHTIEDFSEVCFAVGAHQFAHRFTAPAVWRLSSQPLAALSERFCLESVKPMKTKMALSVLLVSLVVGCSSREIQDEERELLVTVRDLEVYGVVTDDPTNGESFLVKRNLDGSTEIEYEYDSEKDSSNVDTLWLKSEAEVLETDELASTAFDDRISAYKIGAFLASSEAEISEDPELFTLGDESYSAYFEKGGSKLGNVLVIRKGNTVFSLLITGLYFDDPQLLHDLMSPKLEKVDGIGGE
jgi:hypothetical protein